MEEGKEITLTINGCNAASEETEKDGTISNNNNPIAKQISEEYPNVTVIAADGYVRFKEENGKARVQGVRNHKDDGGFITYKNGEKVAKKQMSIIAGKNTVKKSPKKKIENE